MVGVGVGVEVMVEVEVGVEVMVEVVVVVVVEVVVVVGVEVVVEVVVGVVVEVVVGVGVEVVVGVEVGVAERPSVSIGGCAGFLLTTSTRKRHAPDREASPVVHPSPDLRGRLRRDHPGRRTAARAARRRPRQEGDTVNNNKKTKVRELIESLRHSAEDARKHNSAADPESRYALKLLQDHGLDRDKKETP